jgi:GNAT superfamily N-acetyltransferase
MTLSYRTFRNTDPPVLTAIWRSRAGEQGLLQSVSPDLFEQLVFAKLYFDYRGLLVAWDDGRPVGFAHAAFGANAAGDAVNADCGVTCLVMVRPDCAGAEVAAGLLERCEQYLRQRGAKFLYGGGVRPLDPFYVGLYGGSELPGVLDSDRVARELFASHGYQETEHTLILQRDLNNFEAVVDRQQMEIRRRMIVRVTADPPSRSWWEACTLGEFELTCFELLARGSNTPAASATFRSMEPAGIGGVGHAAGLIELRVDPSLQRRGVATFLLTEAFRQFIRQGIMLAEVQTLDNNVAAVELLKKLGFTQSGQGSVFRKEG